MKTKSKRIIIIAAAVLIVPTIIVTANLLPKSNNDNLESSASTTEKVTEPAVPFDALEFAKVYDQNQIKAESEYIGKRFSFTAVVRNISDRTIFLSFPQEELPYPKVVISIEVSSLDSKEIEKAANFRVGQTISFEGNLKDGFVSFHSYSDGYLGYSSGDIDISDVTFYDN